MLAIFMIGIKTMNVYEIKYKLNCPDPVALVKVRAGLKGIIVHDEPEPTAPGDHEHTCTLNKSALKV